MGRRPHSARPKITPSTVCAKPETRRRAGARSPVGWGHAVRTFFLDRTRSFVVINLTENVEPRRRSSASDLVRSQADHPGPRAWVHAAGTCGDPARPPLY